MKKVFLTPILLSNLWEGFGSRLRMVDGVSGPWGMAEWSGLMASGVPEEQQLSSTAKNVLVAMCAVTR